MIKMVFAVDSVKGSGSITFFVKTDTNGCDEDCSTTLEGQRYATHVKMGADETAQKSISHDKSGPHAVVVKAETSNVQSQPVVLNL